MQQSTRNQQSTKQLPTLHLLNSASSSWTQSMADIHSQRISNFHQEAENGGTFAMRFRKYVDVF
ncbi:hypothetical protein ACTXT7_008081 [Hymenolepis weldensis]